MVVGGDGRRGLEGGRGGGAKRRKANGLRGAKKGIKSNPHKPLPNPFIINVI